ncbi:MAG TPA: EAL domain-containing protein [Aquabacterium sp.]|nr:EAL domain-containing protein [Aquabacterium sp.]
MSSSEVSRADVTAPIPYGNHPYQDRLPSGLIVGLMVLLFLVWLSPALNGPFWLHTQWFSVSMHTITEFAAIVVALLVFTLAWHTSSVGQPGNILIIGCGFLAVGLIDLGHVLSYKGMPDFVTPASPEKAIHFWLVGRYTAALTLLVAASRPVKSMFGLPWRYVMLALSLSYVMAVYAIEFLAPQVWPRTFVNGHGLTPFKRVAEYGVIVIAALAAWAFRRWGGRERVYNTTDLCAAALITILSELCLTLYSDVSDLFSLLGHLYKIVAYYFIYRAVFVTSVRDPYNRLSVEVEERREAEQRVEFLAYHDVLTRLPNRDLARDRLTQAIADAHRHGSMVALVFMDLDHFKTINDSLGHAVGDQLLQRVATSLREHVREADTVSRQGGDEFLLILKDLPDVDTVVPIVSKLLAELCVPVMLAGRELTTSASMGIAMYPHDGQDFETLSQKADTAMYRAKAEGRNTYRFFDDRMNQESIERLTLLQELRRALEHKQFVLHYQPQIDLQTRRVVGMEALIRWQHPEKGLIPPNVFIPIAEESGLIVPMGDWVIEEAARQSVALTAQGLPAIPVAVNLSALQFRRGNLEEVVAQALKQSGLSPSLLELELTESVLISDTESVENRLRGLQRMGVTLSIDDFGTGYSSLSYLNRFSVDKLKIDQSFVRDLNRNPDDVGIVRAIIQMASSLGLKTIAEGVETETMAELLTQLGCDEAQGYYFARPMPADALTVWFRDHARA